MSRIDTLIYLWKNDKRAIMGAVLNHFVHWGVFNGLPDEIYVKMIYRVHVGKKLHLDNPVGFNEKLQWLKLYDRNPEYNKMVDKAAVKNYVASIIGQEYIIPTYGVWDSFESIDFSQLPCQFVLKCTHDSGSVCVCTDKETFDVESARKKLSSSLNRNLYYWGREWAYKDVKPRIIAEKYLNDGHQELIDYKFMCFNGKVRCIFTVTNRHAAKRMHVTFYDLNWKILPFTRHYGADEEPIECPKSFTQMCRMAEMIAKDLTFARVDFYEIQGKPYFGEITLCPGNGVEEFHPDCWDDILGSWMRLPQKREFNEQ